MSIGKPEPLKPPAQTAAETGRRAKERRRRMGITQSQLAARTGVSLGSLRRFEQTGQIPLESLIRTARGLDCEDDFDALFSTPVYRSIDEAITETERSKRTAEKKVTK